MAALSCCCPAARAGDSDAAGAALSIEESTHYADLRGALQAQQVVLRGVCYGAAEVRWTLEQATDPSLDLAANLPTVAGEHVLARRPGSG